MAVGPMTFAGSVWLMIAILLGLFAAVMTFINSRKLKGEVFEKPFIYLTLGILFVTLSLIDVTFFQNFIASERMISLIHDFSFIIGLGLMLLASMGITKYLLGLEAFAKNIKKKK